MALLEIDNLHVDFPAGSTTLPAVDGLSLTVDAGDVLGLVGESGSGKSVAMLAVMGLIAAPGRVAADRMEFRGRDLVKLASRERRRILGRDIAMVFQEPMTSLNPSFTIGFQLVEALAAHPESGPRGRAAQRARAIELLAQVGIPAPETRLGAYPHQLSGGMNQRVMIAIAIACNPRLLIADEPTTALDVTIQAQILDLLLRLQHERGMALILITHDMGVVAETARRVAVMYAGRIVEEQSAETLFAAPRHPYTAALLAALPERSLVAAAGENGGRAPLPTIPGTVPGPYDRPAGCLFHPRCPRVEARCRVEAPGLDALGSGRVRCHFPLDPPP